MINCELFDSLLGPMENPTRAPYPLLFIQIQKYFFF